MYFSLTCTQKWTQSNNDISLISVCYHGIQITQHLLCHLDHTALIVPSGSYSSHCAIWITQPSYVYFQGEQIVCLIKDYSECAPHLSLEDDMSQALDPIQDNASIDSVTLDISS